MLSTLAFTGGRGRGEGAEDACVSSIREDLIGLGKFWIYVCIGFRNIGICNN